MKFLRFIAKKYADLNPSLTMCFHMADNELYVDGILPLTSLQLTFGRQLAETKPSPDNLKDRNEAFAELIIDWNAKKIKCIEINGIYFMPGNCDEAIIWGKDIKLIMQNKWRIENAVYEMRTS